MTSPVTAPVFAVARHRLPIDGEGVTTLVTLSQCPLRCRYCLNPQCMDKRAVLGQYTPQELISQVSIDNLYFLATGGGVTFGGGEPLLYSPFIHSFRQECPELWKVNVETSLSVPTSHVATLLADVEQWIIDVKDLHPLTYRRYTHRSIRPLLANLRLLAHHGLQSRCLVRIPLIPGYNDEAAQSETRQWLQQMGFTQFDVFTYILPDSRQHSS